MSFEDKTIVCADCGAQFVHSAEDQARYAERGFANEPKRCRECREKRRAQGPGRSRSQGGSGSGQGEDGSDGARPPRESYEVICAACGAATTVPFKPITGRPVYCRDCFRAKRRQPPKPSADE